MKRRNFIRIASAAAASVVITPAMSCKRVDPKTGLILYTVRGEMDNNPEGTLDRVAEMGYNWIEAADYNNGLIYQIKPAELRRMVESRGMELISNHNGLNPDNVDEVIEAGVEAGLKYSVLPSLPRSWNSSLDGFKEAASFMNLAGEKCRNAGIKFGFHNHAQAFTEIEGTLPFDILAAETDPELVTFQLDLAYISKAGKDPISFFKKYPGRFEMWHVKDLTADGEFATLGEGTIDFKPVFEAAEISGLKYFFVEQDDHHTHRPLESIEISRNYLLDQIL